jgi:hypothetical protein
MFGRQMEGQGSMREFSAAGEQAIDDVARRHGFSPDAVATMLRAVVVGRGRMAQFCHPEFGGSGQWMRGGMTMVGDMFNSTLKARVERLCDELSQLIANEPGLGETVRSSATAASSVSLFVAEPAVARGLWWPPELGQPNSAGAQNGMRYAYFAAQRRLAIDVGGLVTIYDTLDHHIGGVGQQQSGAGSLTFTSQHGVVDVAVLPRVAGGANPAPTPEAAGAASPPFVPQAAGVERPHSTLDLVATIEKLAELRAKGILSEAEFAAKKAELLGRL